MLTRTMEYVLEQLDHGEAVKMFLENIVNTDPDMVIVTSDGKTVETHKILFTMFSPDLASLANARGYWTSFCINTGK